jgi:hypothetical protein
MVLKMHWPGFLILAFFICKLQVVPRIHGFQSTPGDSNVPSGLSQKNELP